MVPLPASAGSADRGAWLQSLSWVHDRARRRDRAADAIACMFADDRAHGSKTLPARIWPRLRRRWNRRRDQHEAPAPVDIRATRYSVNSPLRARTGKFTRTCGRARRDHIRIFQGRQRMLSKPWSPRLRGTEKPYLGMTPREMDSPTSTCSRTNCSPGAEIPMRIRYASRLRHSVRQRARIRIRTHPRRGCRGTPSWAQRNAMTRCRCTRRAIRGPITRRNISPNTSARDHTEAVRGHARRLDAGGAAKWCRSRKAHTSSWSSSATWKPRIASSCRRGIAARRLRTARCRRSCTATAIRRIRRARRSEPEEFYRGLLVFANYWDRQLHDFAPTVLPKTIGWTCTKHAVAKEIMVRPGGVYPSTARSIAITMAPSTMAFRTSLRARSTPISSWDASSRRGDHRQLLHGFRGRQGHGRTCAVPRRRSSA